jgi:hypothetical protein
MDAADRLTRLHPPFGAVSWQREDFVNAGREARRRWIEAQRLFNAQWSLLHDAVDIIAPTFRLEIRFADVAMAVDVPRPSSKHVALSFMKWARCPLTAEYPNPYER